MKEAKTKVQQAKRIARIKKIISLSLAASIVAFLAVFFAFVPFRLLLPAYKLAARQEGEFRLHFLNVKGGVTVVEFPDGEALVVGTGDGSFDSDNTLCRYLRGLDITSLSVLITDADISHVGGMPALCDVFKVQKVYLPAFDAAAGSYQRFSAALDKEGCEQEKLARYGRIVNGSGAYAVCLSPYSEEGSAEDSSTVLYLSYAGMRVVLAGNVTQKREKQLVKEYGLSNDIFDSGEYRVRLNEIDLLCAPSHASGSGSSEEFLSLLSPRATVICCNEKERPSKSALENICTYSQAVYRTDELGVVMVTIKEGDFQVQTHILG